MNGALLLFYYIQELILHLVQTETLFKPVGTQHHLRPCVINSNKPMNRTLIILLHCQYLTNDCHNVTIHYQLSSFSVTKGNR